MYMFNLEAFIPKLCQLAQEVGEDERAQSLRSAGLQALSSMVLYSSCCYCTFRLTAINHPLFGYWGNRGEKNTRSWILHLFKKKKLFEGEWERISNNKDLRFELLFSILSMSKQKKAVILNLCRFCITNDAWIQIIVVCKVVLMWWLFMAWKLALTRLEE